MRLTKEFVTETLKALYKENDHDYTIERLAGNDTNMAECVGFENCIKVLAEHFELKLDI